MRHSLLVITLMIISQIQAICQFPPFVDNTEIIAAGDMRNFHHRQLKEKDSQAPTIDIIYARFNWEINPEILFISGNVATTFKTLDHAISEIQLELNQTMTIDSILHNGEKISWTYQNDYRFSIQLLHEIPPATIDSISIYYQGIPEAGTGFGSFIQSYHGGTPIIWTLSEPYGAKDWWPGKNDLRDKIDSIDVIVTTPKSYRAASHGLLVSEIETGDKKVYHWKHRYPIVSYLVAVAVTNYVSFVNYAVLRGDTLPILEYVFPEDSALIAFQTANTNEMIQLFDTLFGPYPFASEKYGHAQFAWGGGMEHQTMSFMGNYSHDIRAHELAHSWYGNKITLASWHDIFLNEGFATYSTGLSYEHMYNGFYWNIWKSNTRNAVVAQPDGSIYVEDTTDVFRIFNARLSYHKGAYFLHTLRWIMGDENFFAALRNYTSDPLLAYGFASIADFRFHFESMAGFDLSDYFDTWYYGEGYPIYTLDVGQLDDGRIMITIYQEQSHQSVDYFRLPVPVTIYGGGEAKELVCYNSFSGEIFIFDAPGFALDSAKFDENQWIAAKLNALNLSVENRPKTSDLSIYPNPGSDQIEISIPGFKIEDIVVYNIAGNKPTKVPFEITFDKAVLNLSKLEAGIYLIKCTANDGTFFTGKFIKGTK